MVSNNSRNVDFGFAPWVNDKDVMTAQVLAAYSDDQ